MFRVVRFNVEPTFQAFNVANEQTLRILYRSITVVVVPQVLLISIKLILIEWNKQTAVHKNLYSCYGQKQHAIVGGLAAEDNYMQDTLAIPLFLAKYTLSTVMLKHVEKDWNTALH